MTVSVRRNMIMRREPLIAAALIKKEQDFSHGISKFMLDSYLFRNSPTFKSPNIDSALK